MSNTERGGRIALVTGASSGIGGARAELLSNEGFRVFGTSLQKSENEKNMKMLELDVRSKVSIDA